MESILGALALVIIGYTIGSVRVINQGDEALVERLGQYKRSLKPGLNFILPVVDRVLVETMREQILDIPPQPALTRDNVSVTVDAIVYWRILDLRKAYYEVEDLEKGIENLVITNLRAEIGQLKLEEAVSATNRINQALLRQLDEATSNWGVKILRVDIQQILLSEAMQKSLEQERVAESRRKAVLSESEGTVRSIQMIAQALQGHPNSKAVLQYLVAQRYVDANLKLGESDNSKIIFMDPGKLTEAVNNLMESAVDSEDGSEAGNGSNGGVY